ncbi:MAG TPA: Lsr2 family protein [Propionibacteriaceae bacterium]|nr:Lsr2 family protein [Propionibacteriaceae bacterium]
MAKRTQIILVDDLDGEIISGSGKTITFAHAGTAYEIDLAESNAQKLHDALAPFIAAARRVDARRSPAPTPELSVIRAWAKEHGVQVSERGRVSKGVQEAYRAAH